MTHTLDRCAANQAMTGPALAFWTIRLRHIGAQPSCPSLGGREKSGKRIR